MSYLKCMRKTQKGIVCLNSHFRSNSFSTKELDALSHICPLLPDRIKFENNFTDESIYNVIRNISPNLLRIVTFINKGVRDKYLVSRSFDPVFTDEGLCFSLHGLNSHDTFTDA